MHCGVTVAPADVGYRNHCPACLWSCHVDIRPGDRAEACHGPMEPLTLERRARTGYVITHRCLRCGATRTNRAAPDDMEALIQLARATAAQR